MTTFEDQAIGASYDRRRTEGAERTMTTFEDQAIGAFRHFAVAWRDDEVRARSVATRLHRLAEAGRADPVVRDQRAVLALQGFKERAEEDLLVQHGDALWDEAVKLVALGVPLSTATVGEYALHHENPHSRLLGFMLDPGEVHGEGTALLLAFLELVGAGVEGVEFDPVTVQVDKGLGGHSRPDVLLWAGDPVAFVLLVETKVYAGEGGEQCQRYREAAEARWPEATRTFVFLTREGVAPTTDDPTHWRSLSFVTLRNRVLDWASTLEVSSAFAWFLRAWAMDIDEGVLTSGKPRVRQAFRALREQVTRVKTSHTELTQSDLREVHRHILTLRRIHGEPR